VKAIQAHLSKKLDKDFDFDFLLASFDKVRFDNKVDLKQFDDLYQIALKSFYIRYPIDLNKSLKNAN
jgi:hypothetical protein